MAAKASRPVARASSSVRGTAKKSHAKPALKKGAKKAVAKAATPKKVAAKKAPPAKAAPAKAGKVAPAKAAGKGAPAAARSSVTAAAAAAPAPARPKAHAPKPAPPPPPPKPRKPQKPEMTPREIAQVKIALIEQRKEFVREFTEIEDAAFNTTQSELSGEVSYDEDYADAGSFTFEREKELSIGNNIRDLVERVDQALAMIERGTYGLCESCGNPIAKARLQALPYSTMCLTCKQQEERTR